jgi:heme exporter protein A
MPVALSVDSLSKRYGARRVLKSLSFTAADGEVLTIAGPNGSGKSTLLRLLAGLVRPGSGSIALDIDGTDCGSPSARRRSVGFASPDIAFYPELTGTENLSFFLSVRGIPDRARVAAMLARVGLGGRGDDPVGVYSSGMRQRLRLALALLPEPRVLLLDEPGLALDTGGVAVLAELVREQRSRGNLVVLATNDPSEAAWGDRTVVLGN